MNLLWMKIKGFRRFQDESVCNLNYKTIALVGPNESGKSTILEALQHLNSDSAFVEDGPLQEISKELELPPDSVIIEVKYTLEKEDSAEIEDIFHGEQVTSLRITKSVDGTTTYFLDPLPNRDKTHREKALRELNSIFNKPKFRNMIHDHPQLNDDDKIELVEILKNRDDNLSSAHLKQASRFNKFLQEFLSKTNIAYIQNFQTLLASMIEFDSADHPIDLIEGILAERIPEFLLFSDNHRTLKSEYNLSEPGAITAALTNLCNLANLDIDKFIRAIKSGDTPTRDGMTDLANDRLEEIFDQYWNQSKLTVRFYYSDSILWLHVADDGDTYTSIAERSDGLKQFIALIAFIYKHDNKVVPILLIDEVEQHLHYDAQADLIQMFSRQKLVSKIIYTTHSAGCLPEDLGVGVRLIKAIEETKKSIIDNHFWHNEAPGHTPLIVGMGASTLAFIPLRRALFAEGATDFILLPSMLRSVTGLDHLEFQTVQGLSGASKNQLALLPMESPQTAFLTDSDAAGDKIIGNLEEAGISRPMLFQFPKIDGKPTELEDFISVMKYAGAINEYLKMHHGETELKFTIGDFTKTMRSKSVDRWFVKNKLGKPTKRDIAYQLLNLNQSFVDPNRRSELKQLYRSILQAFADD